MKSPRHSARDAFDEANEALVAWREQQKIALTPAQRRTFELAREKAGQLQRAKTDELEGRKNDDIHKEMRARLMRTPNLELKLRGKPVRITQVLADQIIAEYLQPGAAPQFASYRHEIEQAERDATAKVERTHAQEVKKLGYTEQRKLDALLRQFEQARLTKDRNRREFTRAGRTGVARDAFEKAADRDHVREEAIAQAIAKVEKKEDEEKQQRLKDEFNRVR
ncbi:MAG: hypothetical protein RIM84_18650 [Alphaproteobacteria bacterium]